ncbi:CBN-ECH-5 protein [Caenorhabditis brenneri]|uniref:CBN-ECH-5 protein n=1 Tax=Caenorhabditis brenneri TaxID=135651 RepID=G0P433_CAEBE|nr:CBN-ECH-5 protein [Caenorhabditis brenneri]
MLSQKVIFNFRHLVARPLAFSTITDSKNEVFIERLTGKDEGITLLHLNRPEKKNSLGRVFMDQFRQAIEEVKYDPKTRVVILNSKCDNVFCSGADLKERRTMSQAEAARFVNGLRDSFTDIERLPQPVIASIDGFALGGGLELALACDIRVASQKARMGLVETKWALIPGAGGSQRLYRIVGVAKAKELIYTAEVLNGQEAARLGVVNHCVDANPIEKSMEIARKIIPRGPIAVKLAKLAINLGSQTDITSALSVEQQCYAQIIHSKDRLEGLAAFAEKREPVYKGE